MFSLKIFPDNVQFPSLNWKVCLRFDFPSLGLSIYSVTRINRSENLLWGIILFPEFQIRKKTRNSYQFILFNAKMFILSVFCAVSRNYFPVMFSFPNFDLKMCASDILSSTFDFHSFGLLPIISHYPIIPCRSPRYGRPEKTECRYLTWSLKNENVSCVRSLAVSVRAGGEISYFNRSCWRNNGWGR